MTRQIEEKKACVLFRSVVEAAEELDQAEALELLLAYAHIGLGDEVDLDKCSKVVRLILKQNIESLSSAERRYNAAVENGKKGKEHGKKGGRPRKGETKEQAYERRNGSTIPSKTPDITPEETPVNNLEKSPVKPLEVEEEVYIEKEIDNNIYNNININNITEEDKYKNYTWEDYLKLFIGRNRDINYDLDFSQFSLIYIDKLENFQKFLLEKTGKNFPIGYLTFQLTYYATFGRVYQEQEVTMTA